MTQRQIEIIEETWDYVIMNTEEAGMIFYARLFETNPSLRKLFNSDIVTQSQKLISMITFIVNKINNLDGVVKDIKMLGQRHVNYEVKPEHYSAVGATLLWTLEQGLGSKWNDEVSKAWSDVYTLLSNTMMEGASEKK